MYRPRRASDAVIATIRELVESRRSTHARSRDPSESDHGYGSEPMPRPPSGRLPPMEHQRVDEASEEERTSVNRNVATFSLTYVSLWLRAFCGRVCGDFAFSVLVMTAASSHERA